MVIEGIEVAVAGAVLGLQRPADLLLRPRRRQLLSVGSEYFTDLDWGAGGGEVTIVPLCIRLLSNTPFLLRNSNI